MTCVGGYLFEPKAASEFQDEWRKRLHPFVSRGVTHFHAVECAEPDKKSSFANLNAAERLSLFGELVTLIEHTAKVGFVADVEDSVFEQWMIDNPSIRSLVGSKYISCCLQCFRFLSRWGERTHDERPVHYFFENVGDLRKDENDNRKRAHLFDKERAALMNEVAGNPKLGQAFRYGAYTHFPKGEMHALEAADLLAWAHSGLRNKRPTDYARIARRLFRRDGKVRHLCATITPAALTATALFNEGHGLRRSDHVGKLFTF